MLPPRLITDSPVRVSYTRAALITLITLVISQIATAIAVAVCNIPPAILQEVIVVWFALAAIIPSTVSFPLAVVFQRERLKLARAMEQLEQAHAELARRARLDPLTNVLNREAFFSDLESMRQAGERGALLMIDVDHFKTINDNYGHYAGDEALRLIASAIRNTAREEDLVGRLGGEEFGVFVRSTNLALACEIAEQIRLSVSAINFTPKRETKREITVSVGVALQGDAQAPSELFKVADRNMYQAKQSGRNRVQVETAA